MKIVRKDTAAVKALFSLRLEELYQSKEKDFDTIEFCDGRIFERYSGLLFKEGEIFGRVWSFPNVTERKRSEEALRESEEKY